MYGYIGCLCSSELYTLEANACHLSQQRGNSDDLLKPFLMSCEYVHSKQHVYMSQFQAMFTVVIVIWY